MLIALGVFLVVLGLLFTIGEKLPLRLGRLPGDIYVRNKHASFYFPLVTCLLLSVLLSLAMAAELPADSRAAPSKSAEPGFRVPSHRGVPSDQTATATCGLCLPWPPTRLDSRVRSGSRSWSSNGWRLTPACFSPSSVALARTLSRVRRGRQQAESTCRPACPPTSGGRSLISLGRAALRAWCVP